MSNWRNRIVGYGEEDPRTLVANPLNFRRHPDRQRAATVGSLAEVGWVDTVTVNRTSGRVVDGHLRIEEALRAGEASVPVTYVELSEDEERLVLATFDPITAMADIDNETLDELLRSVNTADAGLQAALAELAADAGLYPEKPQPAADPGAQVSRADELQQKWQVQPGDMFALGDHRLICGDCTDAEVVKRLMGGGEAEMVWTDPPYGVAVGDKNKFLNSIAPSNRIEENLQNDTLEEPALTQVLCAAFDNALTVCRAGGAWYVAAPAGPLHVLFGQALKDRGIWRQTIQWVKNNATFSPMGVDYHWQAEPIFYGWKPGAGHRFYGGRQQTTVWEIDRPMASPEHPTMKPVELVVRAIENSSQAAEIVYDSFLGSGTTLIACETLGRRCRAVELHPPYVAVALERWSVMTGQQPVSLG